MGVYISTRGPTQNPDEPSFLKRSREVLPAAVFDGAEDGLRRLFAQIEGLHARGLNGIWARILKNAAAPLFIGNDFDYIVGNPPWINWESLPPDYRMETKPLWFQYGLFPKSTGGMDTILGKGKKDLSMLMTYAVVDRHLKVGGTLSFVITQTVFKTSGSSQGFRRFRIGGSGDWLKIRSVDDLSALQPFEGATNRTAIMVIEKGKQTRFPVAYVQWSKKGRQSVDPDSRLLEALGLLDRKLLRAIPSDPGESTSAWLTGEPGALDALKKVCGQSDYRAREGVNTGGANAVYWVTVGRVLPGGLSLCKNVTEGAKRKVPIHEAPVETELLFPLLRGRDVKRWRAKPSIRTIFVQDPATRKGLEVSVMQTKYPKAYGWFKFFETQLLQRKSQAVRHYRGDGAFYSLFGVGQYSLSPWKVVWPELANEMHAAVVGPSGDQPVLPDHTVVTISTETPDEAHFVCAMLNSAPSRLFIKSFIVMHADPHILEKLRIPKYIAGDADDRHLSELSERAHKAHESGSADEAQGLQREIDLLAASKWGIPRRQLEEIWRSLAPRASASK